MAPLRGRPGRSRTGEADEEEGSAMEAYEREWADLYRRMVQACLRLRRGRSPEEDAVLDVAEEWIRRSIEGAERSRESR